MGPNYTYSIYTIYCLIFTAPLIEDAVFSPLYILTSLGIAEVPHRCMGLSLGFLLCSIGLSFCSCLEMLHESLL